MAKKPTVTTVASGYYGRQALNDNFEGLRDAFDNTLSLDGSTPNAMGADLDMNGNAISNASSLIVGGVDYLADAKAARDAAQAAQTAAETAETNAETAEANAQASETAASTSETNAATSETNSATSASNAATSESNAATSESNAATSETNADASAVAAAASESAAATSESNASTSETNAANSASAAATSEANAEAAFDSFDDRYLGAKASDPTLDNDGDALVTGALYFNSSDDVMKVYDGATWVAAYVSLSGALVATNNLSDVASASVSRTNLGVAIGSDVQAHSSVLDATTASFTTADETKLDGIAAGATNYGDSEVDTHLNTGTASADEFLKWTGSDYDWATVPAGYTDSDVDTHLNYSTATTGQVLSYSGSDYDWVDVAAGANGNGGDEIFWENGQNVTTDYTITNGKNAMSAGPITINSGVTVTVGAGEVWTVV